MKSYKHLAVKKDVGEYDNLMFDNLPPIFFRNYLTSNIILSMESILKVSFEKIQYYKKYFSH